MIIVFDLDDTLYDELTYVKSGLKAVSMFLEEKWGVPSSISFQKFISRLEISRDKIFNIILGEFGLYSKKNVQKCVTVYRMHEPDIVLFPAAEACLQRFSQYPIYIVTDGNKIVQARKILSLQLEERVKHVYITHRYGLHYAKPSPYCFQQICKREKAFPNQVVYIGDNPNKDFVGIKPHGFRTIRILQGQHKIQKMPKHFEAEYRIHSLDELTVDWMVSFLENFRKREF